MEEREPVTLLRCMNVFVSFTYFKFSAYCCSLILIILLNHGQRLSSITFKSCNDIASVCKKTAISYKQFCCRCTRQAIISEVQMEVGRISFSLHSIYLVHRVLGSILAIHCRILISCYPCIIFTC